MFEFLSSVQNTTQEAVFTVALPPALNQVYDDLTEYFNDQGYPDELDIDVLQKVAMKPISPTKTGMMGIGYKFATQRILLALPVTNEVQPYLHAEIERTNALLEDLQQAIQQQNQAITKSKDQIALNDVSGLDAAAADDIATADAMDQDNQQLRDQIKRAQHIVKSKTTKQAKLQPVLSVLKLMRRFIQIKQSEELLKESERELLEELNSVKERIRNYRAVARAANQEVYIMGGKFIQEINNPVSDTSIAKKILMALDLEPL